MDDTAPDSDRSGAARSRPSQLRLRLTQWVQALNADDPQRRAQAAQALAQPRSRRQLRLLIRLLEHETTNPILAVLIGELGEPAVLPLCERLRALDVRRARRARRRLALALSCVRHPSALGPLLRLTEDADPSVIAQAARGLGNFSLPIVHQQLTTLLRHRQARVRLGAIWGLLRADGDVFDAIAALIDDPDLDVRLSVAQGLVGADAARAVPILAARLHEPSLQVPLVALLGEIADPRVLPVLLGLVVAQQAALDRVLERAIASQLRSRRASDGC